VNEGLGSWTGRRRRKSGSKPALVFDGAATTYTDLDDQVSRMSGALAAAGVRRGDRIAYLGDNHPAFLECFFTTAWLGAIFVPLNTRLAAPELNFILKDSARRS
jgi:fatty-acyl-CoA synthase